MTINERLKQFREEQGLTVPQIALACRVSVSTWNNYEKGLTTPRRSILEKICEHFHISMEELIGESEEKPREERTFSYEKLAALRRKKGLSVVEAASLCKVSPNTWRNYEKGNTSPRRSALVQICEALSVREAELWEEPVKQEKRVPKKKLELPAQGPRIIVQSQTGEEASVEEILKKVQRVAPHVDHIYIKPGENRAYWTGRNESDWVWIW